MQHGHWKQSGTTACTRDSVCIGEGMQTRSCSRSCSQLTALRTLLVALQHRTKLFLLRWPQASHLFHLEEYLVAIELQLYICRTLCNGHRARCGGVRHCRRHTESSPDRRPLTSSILLA
jgi:hypothetical protein